MSDPIISHSEITDEIYIVCGTKKYNVTEQVIRAMRETGRLEQQRPHGEWIPCSERLPEEIGDYLVTENISDIALAVYVSSFGHVRTGELCFYYEDEDGRAIKNDGIVAWMSLPKPYKEEGDEK